MFKIVTWNINSIRARQLNLVDLIQKENPDIILLQEIKCLDDQFPKEAFEDLHYNIYIHGQKSYHGVAILSKTPLDDIQRDIPNFKDPLEVPQSRFISADIAINKHYFKVINGYMPNGNPVSSDKYSYKIEWMKALIIYIKTLMTENIPFILSGDFNIIPHDLDVHDPAAWAGDALFCDETREFYHILCNMGLTDAIRFFHPKEPCYSFWDYQARAREKNSGIRIDHFLLCPKMMDHAHTAQILETYRDMPKASDHAPVSLELFGPTPSKEII